MGFLVLEVLTKQDHLPIARAQVMGISHLSLSQPISGFYTLLSPTSKKLGELHVSGYKRIKVSLRVKIHFIPLLITSSLRNIIHYLEYCPFFLFYKVSLQLEPLTEAYDNSTSSPNKDVKNEGVPATTISSQPRPCLACSEQESAVSSSGNAQRSDLLPMKMQNTGFHHLFVVAVYQSFTRRMI